MRVSRACFLALFQLALGVTAFAYGGAIRLSSFPEVGVADARSQLTLTAEVRDGSGKAAPNGTRVLFQTTLGAFRESAVSTTDGYARAVLVSGSLPGVAKVTATAISLNATTSLDVEFLAESESAERKRDFIEVVAAKELRYSMDYQVLSASGIEKRAQARIGNLRIEAEDLQIDAARDELRARRATVRSGDRETNYQELYLKLTTRKGFGTTTYDATVVTGVAPLGHGLRFITETRPRFGLVEISASGRFNPVSTPAVAGLFDFTDVGDTATVVEARKALIFPKKQIQFHRAEIHVQGTRALSTPLYQVNLSGGAPQSFGDQIFTFNDSRIGVDYPHYLSLEPGETSLLRFRTGQRYGRAVGASGGAFLDYELKWDRGDAMQGDLTVSALNTPEWSVDARQHFRVSDGSTISAQVSMPARRSLFGSVSYAKPLKGYRLGLDVEGSRTLTGPKFESERMNLTLESDPARPGGLPLTLYYGLTANDSRRTGDFYDSKDRSVGLRMRGTFDTLNVDSSTSLATSFSLGQRWSAAASGGLAVTGSAALTRQLGSNGNLSLNYEYTQDPAVTFDALGSQRLSLQGQFSMRKLGLGLYASKSLDSDWTSLYADFSYRLSQQYRLSGSYTLDEFVGDRSLDYAFTFAYRLGVREIGLTWSHRTGRVGLELLGARF